MDFRCTIDSVSFKYSRQFPRPALPSSLLGYFSLKATSVIRCELLFPRATIVFSRPPRRRSLFQDVPALPPPPGGPPPPVLRGLQRDG